ncbi:MAG TPA: hypothetical protein VFW96_23795, partial [Thermomicrobiales bacterium]|nr:hypothetical protein [Thermomicrobiales bacterium]
MGELDESGEPPPADGPAGGEWRVIFGRNKGTDFSLEAVGLVVPKDVRAGRGPYLAIDDEILQLWYIAVSHRHSTLRIERHWRPGTGVADSEHGVKRPATGEEMRTERAILKLAWSLL